jgi:four helix bundle protein
VNVHDAYRSSDTLSYERLDVYQRTIEFLAIILPVIDDFPRGHAAVRDQLRRAALSIALNIAEGVGRTTATDTKRFYAIARGSATECGAVLDVGRLLRIVEADTAQKAKGLLERIVSMLTKMAR